MQLPSSKLELTPYEIGMLHGLLLKHYPEYNNDPCILKLIEKLAKVAVSYYSEEK